MPDNSLKPGPMALYEALSPDTTEPMALGGAMGRALRRSLDSILAQVETMLVLHEATLDPSTERRLRQARSHLWLAQDLLLGVVPAQPEYES